MKMVRGPGCEGLKYEMLLRARVMGIGVRSPARKVMHKFLTDLQFALVCSSHEIVGEASHETSCLVLSKELTGKPGKLFWCCCHKACRTHDRPSIYLQVTAENPLPGVCIHGPHMVCPLELHYSQALKFGMCRNLALCLCHDRDCGAGQSRHRCRHPPGPRQAGT